MQWLVDLFQEHGFILTGLGAVGVLVLRFWRGILSIASAVFERGIAERRVDQLIAALEAERAERLWLETELTKCREAARESHNPSDPSWGGF